MKLQVHLFREASETAYIDCKVSGIDEAASGYKFVVVAVDMDSGREYAASWVRT